MMRVNSNQLQSIGTAPVANTSITGSLQVCLGESAECACSWSDGTLSRKKKPKPTGLPQYLPDPIVETTDVPNNLVFKWRNRERQWGYKLPSITQEILISTAQRRVRRAMSRTIMCHDKTTWTRQFHSTTTIGAESASHRSTIKSLRNYSIFDINRKKVTYVL